MPAAWQRASAREASNKRQMASQRATATTQEELRGVKTPLHTVLSE